MKRPFVCLGNGAQFLKNDRIRKQLDDRGVADRCYRKREMTQEQLGGNLFLVVHTVTEKQKKTMEA